MNAPGLADRGARLLAASIDELIMLGLFLPMLYGAIPSHAEIESWGRNPELLDTDQIVSTVVDGMLSGKGIAITVVALLAWCVITTWLVATNGQSIGKRLVGIKVVRTDGSPASFARIFLLRNVLNFVPTVLPYVGWLYQLLIDPLLIYQESRRCGHDMIADTIVIRCVSKASGSN